MPRLCSGFARSSSQYSHPIPPHPTTVCVFRLVASLDWLRVPARSLFVPIGALWRQVYVLVYVSTPARTHART